MKKQPTMMNGIITLKWLDQRFDRLDTANIAIFKQFDQVDRGIAFCLARINDIEERCNLILVEIKKLQKSLDQAAALTFKFGPAENK